MTKKILILSLLVLVSVLAFSQSTIKGFVYEYKINAFSLDTTARYAAADQDVYIIYGNDPADTYFDDDIETSYDGSFEFEFLEPGNYRVFVYEDCNTCFSGKKETIYPITITDKKEVVDMGTIEVFDNF